MEKLILGENILDFFPFSWSKLYSTNALSDSELFFEIWYFMQKLLIFGYQVFQRYLLSTSHKWHQNVKMTSLRDESLFGPPHSLPLVGGVSPLQ